MVQTNTFRSFPVSQTCSHLGTVSSSHVYSARIFAEHIQLWNQNSLSFVAWSQGGVDYNIVSPFHSTITEVVVRGLRSSSVAVAHEGYLVQSRRPLWFGSSQANCSVFNTLSTPRWLCISHTQCHHCQVTLF